VGVPTAQEVLDREQALDSSAWEALAQRERESKAAHAAFLDYVRMGPRRSIRQLHTRYVQQTPGKALADSPPTTGTNLLLTLSTHHD
jgi:hypothetical protein